MLRCADERSVITYLVSYYLYFSQLKAEEVDMKRLHKLLDYLIDVHKMQTEYERMSKGLLDWIRYTVETLKSRNLFKPSSLRTLGSTIPLRAASSLTSMTHGGCLKMRRTNVKQLYALS